MSAVKSERAFAEGSPLLPPSPNRHSLVRRWARRIASLTLYTVLWALMWVLLPLLLPIAWVIDRIRGKSVLVRGLLFFAVYLGCEMWGVLLAFFIWLFSLVWMGGSRHRFLRWNFQMQCMWLRAILGSIRRIFRWRVVITGDDSVARGNILFLIRHASTADTLLAGVLVSDVHGICLRYVLKDQLLWDPCLDIVGNRLPNGFVARGGGDKTARAVAEVARLADDLGPYDGVLIYPEGTRFTDEKRTRILGRLAEKAAAADNGDGDSDSEATPAHLARARALTYVLPPRLAGPLALLERATDADVVFCAHTGLERALSFHQVMAGGLNDVELHVGFWRVARADIPESRAERITWLYDEWARVDAWVGARQGDETTENRNGPSLADSGAGSGGDD